MNRRRRPFGTAQAEVLLKLTSSRRPSRTWSRSDEALYESRAMTDNICRSLVPHGFLTEAFKPEGTVYTVTKAGEAKAKELRIEMELRFGL